MNLLIWNRFHCIALCITATLFIFVHSISLFVYPCFVSFVYLFNLGKNELVNLKPVGGWANIITAIRFSGIVLLSFIYKMFSNMEIAGFLFILILLDGADGFIARKLKQQTEIGAYFDMETDAFFVCIVSCILFLKQITGFEILIAGFFRYFYVFILYILGLQNLKEKRTKIGPVVAVFLFIALASAFILPKNIASYILNFAIILLIVSFSYSFWLLIKQPRLSK
jgi:phosphatidylglycerophosphate synthase